ncbi:MAG: hypothetical protein JNM47_08435 [Hyphomonadaceae bacterium]|nr:hypothetical protein [Hyphomonadaceae bacterium]
MLRVIVAAITPGNLFGWIALALGGMSVAAVFEAGTGVVLPDPLAPVRAAYEHLLAATVGRVEVIYKPPIAWVNDTFGLDLSLPPVWTHVFVLLGVYFFREAAINVREKHHHSAVFNVIVGAACGLCASAFIAALSRSGLPAAGTLASLSVVFAAFVYHQAGTLWDATVNRALLAGSRNQPVPSWGAHYLNGLRRGGLRLVMGSLIAVALMQVPMIRALPEPSLLVSLLLVFAFAVYWLADGVRDARLIRRKGETAEGAYLRSAHTQLGLDMLRPFIGLSIILIASAVYRAVLRLRG